MDNESNKLGHVSRFHRWQPAAVLRIGGEDAFTFLQGQFTNDLRQLDTSGAVYGLWLNHKGRVLADSFVRRGDDGHFWVVSYFCPAARIAERLEAFVISDDVTIDDVTTSWQGITFLGGSVPEAVAGLGNGSFSFVGRRTNQAHQEVLFPSAMAVDVAAGFQGIPDLGAEELERMRIADLIPAVPMDIGEGELPNEGGLDAVAISYNKGCYLGQEVMARLKSMGQVRRRLHQVEGSLRAESLPAALFQGDRRIGELRTQVAAPAGGWIGLALLSLINLQPETGISFSPGGEVALRMGKSP